MAQCAYFNCRNSNSLNGCFCLNGRWIPGVETTDTTVQTVPEDLSIQQESNFPRLGRMNNTTLEGAELCNSNPKFPTKSYFSHQMSCVGEQSTYSSEDNARKGVINLLMDRNSEDRMQEWTVSNPTNPALFYGNKLYTEDGNMGRRTDFSTAERQLNIDQLRSVEFQMGLHRINQPTQLIPILFNNPDRVNLNRPHTELMPRHFTNDSVEYQTGLRDMQSGGRPGSSKRGISWREKPETEVDVPVDDPLSHPGPSSRQNEPNSPVHLEITQYIAAAKRNSVVDVDERKFICPVCEKRFKQTCHLKIHFLIHSRIKKYKCDFCKKSFARKQYLQTHVRTHTGERPFQCEVCGKSFTKKIILRRHDLVHSGAKPFSCKVCRKRFPAKHSLNYHMKNHEHGPT